MIDDPNAPATKGDVAALGGDLRGEMQEMQGSLRGEMQEMKESLRGEMQEMKGSLRGEMQEMNTSLRQDLQDMEVRVARTISFAVDGVKRELRQDMARFADSIVERVGDMIGVVDDKYRDLPDRVSRLERDVDELKRR